MSNYSVKSPTRVDFSGGLLDVWPIYSLIEDCFVVNMSIPVFTYAELNLKTDSQIQSFLTSASNIDTLNIEVSSLSTKYQKSFSCFTDFLKQPSYELTLLKKHFLYWQKHLLKHVESKNTNLCDSTKNNINMYLKSESPIGGGLGGSSSLCVNLVKIFCNLFKKSLTQTEFLLLCRNIETSILKSPAGIQDYIPAMEPSKLNHIYIIECTALGPIWKSQKMSIEFLKEHVLLINTKQSHHSGTNNWDIIKKTIDKNPTILKGLNKLRDNSLKMVNICETQNWSDLFIYLKKEHQLRQQFLFNWITPPVSKVINLILEGGADCVKLCGAGGGGCLLVLAKNKKIKQAIETLCHKHDIPVVMNYNF